MLKKSSLSILLLFATFFCKASEFNFPIIFIENNIDNEYFIAPPTATPRFSGANVFTKYSLDQQDSLGYMGYTGGPGTNDYLDIWLENSPIRSPFVGQRCMRNATACPKDGMLKADYILDNGAYHIPITTTSGGAGTARGIFSDSMYHFIKQLSIGTTQTLDYFFCYTKKDYDPKLGQTCQSINGKTNNHIFHVTKTGHMTLKSTNALQEIFVDSNGNAILGLGSKFCENTVIGKQEGIMCALVDYDFKGEIDKKFNIDIILKLNPILGNLNSTANKALMIGDGDNYWVVGKSGADMEKIIHSGNGEIYLFMGKAFLKDIIDRKVDLSKSQELFTFLIDNKNLSQSGYYEFTPSNTLIIKPRDYGISIVSKEMINKPYREGKVGDKEPPLTFDYIVTTSAFRQANKITAAVEGPQITLRGQSYCLFSSKDKKINVPFSAYLTYTDQRGSKVKTRTACDNVPISIKEALWTQTTWPYPYQLEGYFYRTDLQLTFPMNEGTSLFSMEGEDWIGVVEASGYVNVFAEWSGTDVH